MSIKDELVKKVSEELEINENVVEKVVSWSYKKANEAMSINNEVEISGIGKFMLSKAKLNRRIGRYEDMVRRFNGKEVVAEALATKLQTLKTRKDALELQGNNSGLEEHIDSTEGR